MKRSTNVSRRNFLKLMSQTGGAAALGALAKPSFLSAQSTGGGSGVNVVVVNLLGGLDGLAAFPFYEGPLVSTVNNTLRPSLSIAPSSVLSINSQSGVANKIGLHPEFAPLVNVAGSRMKIIQGYGIPGDPGRSHDTCQVIMSLGRTNVNDPQMKGFLARLMDQEDWDTLQYWAFDVSNPSDVNTSKKAPVRLNDLDSFNYRGTWWEDDAQVRQAATLQQNLLALQAQSGPLASKYSDESALMHDAVGLVQSSIANQAVGNNDAGNYTGDWGIGVQLRDIAKVIRAKHTNSALSFSGTNQVFLAHQGGYDTHSDQANPGLAENSLSMRLRELATNLSVFYRDLELMGAAENTYVIVYSEFGRTCAQNAPASFASAGTDHGHGSNTIVFGGRISPGVIGEAPSQSELTDPWYNALSPRIDYRDIFAEIFNETMSISPATIFPDSSYTYQKLGII